MYNLCILQKNKTFSILHPHFYKTSTFSLTIFYYFTATHGPTNINTHASSNNISDLFLLSSFPFPSFFFCSFTSSASSSFSILHTHFYKTPALVCLFYILFYLNNISHFYYYFTATHDPPILTHTPTQIIYLISFFFLLFSFPSPSFFFCIFTSSASSSFFFFCSGA